MVGVALIVNDCLPWCGVTHSHFNYSSLRRKVMEKTIIRFILALLMMCMSVVAADAQSSYKNYKLVMRLADGDAVSSAFSKKPVIKFSQDGVTMKNAKGELGSWKYGEVAKWTFEVDATTPGDANEDGNVSVADLSFIASYVLGDHADINEANADVNGDGQISVADLSALASIILSQGAE